MKVFLSLLIVCFFSCAITYRVISSSNNQNEFPSAALSDSSLSIANLTQKVQLLERENGQLKKQLNLTPPSVTSKDMTVNPNIDASTVDVVDEKKPTYEEQFNSVKRAADFSGYLNSLQEKNISMASDLNKKFSDETIDYSWAPGYQQKIEQLFYETESLKGFSPTAVECKTTKCQIKIPIANNDEANTLTAAFAAAIYINTGDIVKTEVIAAPDFTHGLLNLYIAKNNNAKAYE